VRAGHGLEQLVRERHVDHRTFVGHQKIAVERMVRVALELAIERVDFQQTMDRLRFQAGRFGKALGRPTGGRTQQRL
jgi:hypothetical protein